jgi:serine protease AprX
LLEKLHKLSDVSEFPFINAFGVKLNFNEINKIAALNSVNYITSSLKVQTQVNFAKEVINLAPSNIKHNFSCVVIDTGVSLGIDVCIPHNKIIEFVDFVNNKNFPYDDNGHGTFVTNVLAGSGLVSNKKYMGIDPCANIIAIKALDANGETGVINILKAMQWVLDNKQKYNIKVVCMSFGSVVLTKNDPLIIGAEALWNNGITVVAAAGNSGPETNTIKSPGASSKIITVGAINDNRMQGGVDYSKLEIADFSSRGPALNNFKPDVVAPGVNIVSGCSYKLNKKHYDTMSGTSVATPIVAGVCSLLLAKNEYLSPNDVKHILLNNTIKLGTDRNSEGLGLINCKNFVF